MPDLSTVVNMFFGADNNKVLYRGQKCKLNNKWLSNFL